MKRFYLIMAVLGTLLPYFFFIDHFRNEGFGLGGFVSNLFANGAAGGFSADLVVSSCVFWAFLWQDSGRAGVRHPWIFVVLNLSIGLSCALPLYLYFRHGSASGLASASA